MEVLFIMDTSGSFISPLQSVFSFFAKQYSTGLQSRKNRDIFMPSLTLGNVLISLMFSSLKRARKALV